MLNNVPLNQSSHIITVGIVQSPESFSWRSNSLSLIIIPLMYPAIFLDRDGVIIENRPRYVRSWADVKFYPDSLRALASVSISLYKVVIVTNQSAVGRGIITKEQAESINQRVVQVIQQNGGRVDGIFMCPHAPQDKCLCRKPEPGLLNQAAAALSLDLSRSVMIGDALSDLLAAQAAGLPLAVLVSTGRGKSQARLTKPERLKPFLIYASLANALAGIDLEHATGLSNTLLGF